LTPTSITSSSERKKKRNKKKQKEWSRGGTSLVLAGVLLKEGKQGADMSDFKEEELQQLRAQLATQQAQINSQKASIASLAAGQQRRAPPTPFFLYLPTPRPWHYLYATLFHHSQG
jgi:c-di-GMP-binding flagellar brake protein YcgR